MMPRERFDMLFKGAAADTTMNFETTIEIVFNHFSMSFYFIA